MQKEKLSALMDGETLDSELLKALTHDPEMQKTWESYHLIRDSMRGDTPDVLHFDISARVMAAIENEAACVSLAVIVGVQHYNGQSETSQQPETPVFNTLPMMGKASPVSLVALMPCCRTMNCSADCTPNSFSLSRRKPSKPRYRCQESKL